MKYMVDMGSILTWTGNVVFTFKILAKIDHGKRLTLSENARKYKIKETKKNYKNLLNTKKWNRKKTKQENKATKSQQRWKIAYNAQIPEFWFEEI